MWSIAIYTGLSPYSLHPYSRFPALTKESVTDVKAAFVADPFMIRGHMFFEVMNEGRGEIGLATSSNGFEWKYERIVLREDFHLSYPYVFGWKDSFYMIPETLGANAACLYQADDFPWSWKRVEKLIDGPCADPSIIRFNNLWWLFTCPFPYEHDTLRLHFAEELTGPWREHPKSPIIRGDKCRARPAGRLLVVKDRLIRFAQDCVPQYGTRVRAFDILELTTTKYVEVENAASPILQPTGNGWNADGMHHVDAQHQPNGTWIACVDGYRNIADCRLPIAD